jgi:hypothetical protein
MDGMQINDIRVFFTNCDKYARGELVVERKMKKISLLKMKTVFGSMRAAGGKEERLQQRGRNKKIKRKKAEIS